MKYAGDLENPGTDEASRTHACYTACKDQSVNGGAMAAGFAVTYADSSYADSSAGKEANGRCYCETLLAEGPECDEASERAIHANQDDKGGYKRYDFACGWAPAGKQYAPGKSATTTCGVDCATSCFVGTCMRGQMAFEADDLGSLIPSRV